jgi:hypothetical protein
MNVRRFITDQRVILCYFILVFLFAYFYSAPIAAILLGLSGMVVVGFLISGPKYKGPVSDHFDGKKFFNLDGVKAKGLGDVLKWAINRKRGEWKEGKDIPYGDKPIETVTDKLRITFVNHSTFLIQVNGLNILTDPGVERKSESFYMDGPEKDAPSRHPAGRSSSHRPHSIKP